METFCQITKTYHVNNFLQNIEQFARITKKSQLIPTKHDATDTDFLANKII